MLLIPYALGDRVAMFALLLRPLAQASFLGSLLAWTLVASLVVIPAAFVSGYQFPIVIGLYGRGTKNVGHHVGHAYLANTLGSIVGSLSGGFGLLPLLSAPRCWQLVGMVLLVTAVVAAVADLRFRGWSLSRAFGLAVWVPAALCLNVATGPTAAWRHSGIGAGRAELSTVSRERIEQFIAGARADVAWEADGLESSVAVTQRHGYTFMVNGKADGSIVGDAGTQIMSGILAALLHDDVKRALVVGLGTGSTAGWLGAVPNIERVDVVELEPAILRVARDCALANQSVMDNPKVKVTLGDAREVLRTTPERYDIIFSEPSNPYRAGISSLYTEEFYRAATARLKEGGLFVQWIQAYEVDALAIATATVTLRQALPSITIWQTQGGDLLLVARRSEVPIDVARLRQRLATEPYASAARQVWLTTSAEGVLARFVANPAFVDMLAEQGRGLVNTDDQNFLEFAFAQGVGLKGHVAKDVRSLAARLHLASPRVVGSYDAGLVGEEGLQAQLIDNVPMEPDPDASPELLAYAQTLVRLQKNAGDGLAAWTALGRAPRSYYEAMFVAQAALVTGDARWEALAPKTLGEATSHLLQGLWLARQRAQPAAAAIDALEQGFIGLRKDPWVRWHLLANSLDIADQLGKVDPKAAHRFALALSEPFAVQAYRRRRLEAFVKLARASADPALCVRAIDSFGLLPMDGALYESRVVCFQQASDPRLPDAELQHDHLLSYSLPFGPISLAALPTVLTANAHPAFNARASVFNPSGGRLVASARGAFELDRVRPRWDSSPVGGRRSSPRIGIPIARSPCYRDLIVSSGRRGFSAVELMNFLAFAAILTAIGMYALARYVRHGKTTEARESVLRLAKGAADYYNLSDATQPSGAAPKAIHAMRHFPPSSKAPVPEDPLSVRGKKYQSNIVDWASSPWRDLSFNMVQPQCYQYSFDAQGAGASAKAQVTAEGDLDGDGTRSKFSLAIAPNESLTAVVAKEMQRTDLGGMSVRRFTPIELAIGVALLGSVAAVAIPTFVARGSRLAFRRADPRTRPPGSHGGRLRRTGPTLSRFRAAHAQRSAAGQEGSGSVGHVGPRDLEGSVVPPHGRGRAARLLVRARLVGKRVHGARARGPRRRRRAEYVRSPWRHAPGASRRASSRACMWRRSWNERRRAMGARASRLPILCAARDRGRAASARGIREEGQTGRRSAPLPPPSQLRAMSLGYRTVGADLVWAKLVVEHGLRLQEKRQFPELPQYIEGIIALDPDHPDPLPIPRHSPHLQTRGRYGRRRAPRSPLPRTGGERRTRTTPRFWLQYGQFLAFLSPSFLKDPAETEQWKKTAQWRSRMRSSSGRIPIEVSAVSTILTKAGERASAIKSLERSFALTDDPETRRQILIKLATLEASVDAESVVGIVEHQWRTNYSFLSARRDAADRAASIRGGVRRPRSDVGRNCPRDWSGATKD